MTDKTNTERQAAFRARKRQEGAEEVRGIYAPKPLHRPIKEAARRIVEKGKKDGD